MIVIIISISIINLFHFGFEILRNMQAVQNDKLTPKNKIK